MQKELIDNIKKELSFYGISIEDNVISILDLKKKVSFGKFINFLNLKIHKNRFILENIFKDLENEINNSQKDTSPVGEGDINLFIYSVKDTVKFYDLMLKSFNYQGLIDIESSYLKIKSLLNNDIKDISSHLIYNFPNYKIAISWIYRQMCVYSYIINLLKYYIKVKNNSKNIKNIIKEARGFQGPYGNVDLAMKERILEWNEIQEELEGRTLDRQSQRRYEMGLENYHEGRVGEGFMWREVRNEPYSWYSKEDNPYPHRDYLWEY